jgi:bilirubin oxidase
MKSGFAFLFFIVTVCFQSRAQGIQPLWIPDTLSGPVINLSLAASQKQILPGAPTQTLAYNGLPMLGPTLMLRRGWQIETTVQNNLSDTSTLHWHGLHVSAHTDGGPHSPILPGQQWNPHFTCLDKASTYWYHPHFHKKTARQTLSGAAGLIIVRDGEEAALPLPRRYGINDFPLIIQSLEMDAQNQIKPEGQQDSLVLVNGTFRPYLQIPAGWVRFRVLNASNARNFYLGLQDTLPLFQIGSDGGLLGKPLKMNRVKLSPGERAEIMVDFSGKQDSLFRIISFGSEIPSGIQGGPTIPVPPGGPSMASPLNGKDFEILELRVTAPLSSGSAFLPDSLAAQTRIPESQAQRERLIRFSSAVPGSTVGPFLVNDSLFNMNRIDFSVPVNSTEIWTLYNQTTVAHPFHLHGFQFYILDRFGAPPPPEETGRKDMVLLTAQEQVRIIARFANFADTTMPYMFHCHLLTHEDEGMMGQFVVAPLTSAMEKIKAGEPAVFPNPFSERLYGLKKNKNIKVVNILGQPMRLIWLSPEELDTSSWPAGLYGISGVSGKRVRK